MRAIHHNKKLFVIIFIFLLEAAALIYIWSLGDLERLPISEPSRTLFFKAIQYALVGVSAVLLITIIVLLLLLVLISILGGRMSQNYHIVRTSDLLKIRRTAKITLLVIVIIGAFLRFSQPFEHQLFYDEAKFLYLGNSILDTGRATGCAFAVFNEEKVKCLGENISVYTVNKGYPLLLTPILYLFGDREDRPAFFFNIFLGIATIPLVFFFVKELSASEGAGLFAAAFTALLPEHIRWSATVGTEIPTLFFLFIGLFSLLLFIRRKQYAYFILSLLILSYASFMRTEMILALPFLIIFILSKKSLRLLASQNWKHVLATVFASIFIALNIASILISRFNFYRIQQSEGAPKSFTWSFFYKHLLLVIKKHLEIPDPIFFLILGGALIGIYVFLRTKPRFTLIGVLIPLTFFALYLSYQSNAYPENAGITSLRYTPIWLTLWATLAGVGIDFIVKKITTSHAVSTFAMLGFAVLFIVFLGWQWEKFFQPSFYAPFIQEGKARYALEKENPQCFYIVPVAYEEMHHGFPTITYGMLNEQIPDRDAVIQSYPCLILFGVNNCPFPSKNCDAIVQSILGRYEWRRLPYDALPAWQLIEEKEQGMPSTSSGNKL